MRPMLANYSSLWEVFTAFYSSMLLSDILGGIWTPEYKKTVTELINEMGIPFVKKLSRKLSNQVEDNVKEISGHMHRRAIFMILFSICLLVLTGAESNMGFTKDNITEILFWAAVLGTVVVLLGAFTFKSYYITVPACIIYGISFFGICHYGHEFSITWELLSDEKYAIGFLLFFMCIPIGWQIMTCWIYSSLYYGKLKEELHKEEIAYKMAIIGIRTKNLDIVPEKYRVRAAIDIHKQTSNNEDLSYDNCDNILYASIDSLLERPIAISILLSWCRHVFRRIFSNKTYGDSEFINAQFNSFQQEKIPVSGLSHSLNASESLNEHLTTSLSDRHNGVKESVVIIKNVRNIIMCIFGVGVISALMHKYKRKAWTGR